MLAKCEVVPCPILFYYCPYIIFIRAKRTTNYFFSIRDSTTAVYVYRMWGKLRGENHGERGNKEQMCLLETCLCSITLLQVVNSSFKCPKNTNSRLDPVISL